MHTEPRTFATGRMGVQWLLQGNVAMHDWNQLALSMPGLGLDQHMALRPGSLYSFIAGR